MVAPSARAAFIGRTQELERLRAAATRALAGRAGAVLCLGEAGIGKSRLLQESVAALRADGVAVLEGGCVELGSTGLPYGPFAAALRGAVREGVISPDALHDSSRRRIAVLVPEMAPAAARVGRRGTREPADVDPHAELGQVPLFEAVLAALEAVGREDGLVLVIEDLHWADRSTLDLLTFLVHNLGSNGLLLVVSVRTDGLDRRHPVATMIAELARRPAVERLDLGPLDLEDTGRQLSAVLGFEADPVLARRIHARTEGNPFFIEQLAQAQLDGEDGVLPPSLRDLLISQLSRLPPDVQRLLAAVAVAGTVADDAVLAEMLEAATGDVLRWLRLAVEQHVLVPLRDGAVEGYGFHHALVAEAAESDLLEGERRRLHARCADALGRRRPGDGAALAQWAGRIAFHRERSGERRLVVEASIEAALAAQAAAAHADASVQFRRAIEHLRPEEAVPYPGWDRAELLGRAGTAAASAGDPTEAARLTRLALDELPAEADPYVRGGLLTRLGEYQWTSSDPAFVDTLRLAAEIIPRDPPTAILADALVSLGFHHQYLGDDERAIMAYDEARRVAKAVPDAQNQLAIVDSCLAVYAYEQGDRQGGDDLIREGVVALREPGVDRRASAAWMDLVGVVAWAGDDEWAVELAEEGLARTRASGNEAYYGSLVAANGAESLLSLGRIRDGLAMLDSVRTVASGGYLDGAYLTMRAALLTALGDLDGARRDLDSIDLRTRQGDASIERVRAYVDAELFVTAGEPLAARAVVDAALELPPSHIPLVHEVGLLIWTAIRAEADLAERGRARRLEAADAGAARATTLLADLEQQVAAAAPASPATARGRGFLLLARAEETRRAGRSDPDAWAAAVHAWSALPLVLRGLYARIREAEALLARGRSDRSAAAERLLSAYAETRRLGAGPLSDMAAGIARRARVELGEDAGAAPAADDGPTPIPIDGGAAAAIRTYGLTARELEILSLLAAGLTNRQIGERLYISPKTAGVHVSNLLGKLGVNGRVQAATLAHHLGIRAPEDADELTA